MIPAAIAKRPIPGGVMLTGVFCVVAGIYPAAPWPLPCGNLFCRCHIVGVFLPLLEAGSQIVNYHKEFSQSAGTCIFACAFVNPMFGWAAAMRLDNLGFTGDTQWSETLTWNGNLLVCSVFPGLAGQLPGIPGIF